MKISGYWNHPKKVCRCY